MDVYFSHSYRDVYSNGHGHRNCDSCSHSHAHRDGDSST